MQQTLTIKQCAENLQVSERTVRTMIAEKRFCKHIKIGRQIRFDEDEFESWKNRQDDEETRYAIKAKNRTINKVSKILEK